MKFRKRPVVIEAMQVPYADDPLKWGYLVGFLNANDVDFELLPRGDGLEIKTLEGVMRADRDDWIIKGVKGELYPCKPDIFALTYEPEEPDAHT